MKKIVIIAGDKSADIYGGLLCKQLKEKYPKVELFSFGGEHLAKESKQVINLLAHSVSGLVEVISSIKKMLDIFRQTLKSIDQIKPDLVILMDFPDFNLRLAKALNKKYSLFYYISPQVWAWRKKRVDLIKEYVDKMVVIFKFEEEFYKKEGVQALYFGHPLLEIVKPSNLPTKNIISFLPGSRKNEIKKHIAIMNETKSILQEKLPDYSFRIIRPENIDQSFYEQFFPNMEVVQHSHQKLEESKFIITASGTATVEIAVLEVPFLIIYKVNSLTWSIAKRIVKTDFVGMVNILSKKGVIPELLQNEANPSNIANTALEIINSPGKYKEMKNALSQVHTQMHPENATAKFAEYIGSFLNLS